MSPSQEAHLARAREEHTLGHTEHALRRVMAAFPAITPAEARNLLSPPKPPEKSEEDERIEAAAETALIFDDYTAAVLDLFKRMPSQRKSIKTEALSEVEVMNICSEVTEQIGYLILCNKNPTEIFRTFFAALRQHGFDKATGAPILRSDDPRKDTWISNLDCMSNPALRVQIQDALKKTLEESNLTDDLIKSL